MTPTLPLAESLSSEGSRWRADLDPPLRGGWFARPKCKIKSLLCAARSESLLCTSGILPSALRAAFGVRPRSCSARACPMRSNQEKGHPGFPAPRKERARGTLRCSESVGRRDRAQRRRRLRSSRCRAAAELAHPCAQTCAPFPAGFFRYSAENERGFIAKSQELASFHATASLAPLMGVWPRCARHQVNEAEASFAPAFAPAVAVAVARGCRSWLLGSPSARAEQRSQGRGKGAHVRGHGWPSSRRPGHGEQRRVPRELYPRGARLGCPSLWLLSLGQARESDSLPRRGTKAFDVDVAFGQQHNHPAMADQDPPSNSSLDRSNTNQIQSVSATQLITIHTTRRTQ